MSTEPRPTPVNGIVITFFSTASAVGKTLVACNMASELAREGYRVCLVDFDLQFGDVCHFLKLQPTKTLADLQRTMQVEGDSCRVQDFLTPYDRADVHFSVLAAPKLLEEAYNIHHDYAVRAVRALQRQFDYILIDMASMFSTLNLAMLDQSTIVTFLGIVDFLPTIKNMKIGMDTLKTLGYDKNKIRLVLNRSDAKTRISLAPRAPRYETASRSSWRRRGRPSAMPSGPSSTATPTTAAPQPRQRPSSKSHPGSAASSVKERRHSRCTVSCWSRKTA